MYPRSVGTPLSIEGSFPLFYTPNEAVAISPTSEYITVQFENRDEIYYYPLGLPRSILNFSAATSTTVGDTDVLYTLGEATSPSVVSLDTTSTYTTNYIPDEWTQAERQAALIELLNEIQNGN